MATLNPQENINQLKNLISLIHQSGGLVNCNGTHAPAADPEWSDLGEAILSAHTCLATQGIDVRLQVQDFDGTVDEYLDEL